MLHPKLRRGWGLELELRGPGFAPLVGAAVLLDGAKAGETDAGGELLLSASHAPDRIDVRYLDWVVEPESRTELVDALAEGRPRARLLLSPRD